MQIPLQITFKNMESSPAVEDAIRERAAKLEKIYPRITSCRVVIESPHRRHQKGKLFAVRVDMTVPGEEIVVSRDPGRNGAYEDVYVAIRDAFDAAKRELQDHARRFRGEVKLHDGPSYGRVVRLEPTGFGFLGTLDGREVYFHQNAVLRPGFDQLHVGDTVRYVEETGNKGPQASTVEIVQG